MSCWDILLRVACLPELSGARYGFHKSRRGGAQLRNPMGSPWPMSPYINCCTWVAQSIGLSQFLLGRNITMSSKNWLTAMCMSVGDAGAPEMVVDMGLAKSYQEGIPPDLVEGDWLVCQGWIGGGGHSFLLRVVPAGDGEAEIGVMWLEAAGRARGGPTSTGIDGIGSRTCSVPNARNWNGFWPAGSEKPISLEELSSVYAVLYTALLD